MKIVTICGSMQFQKEMMEEAEKLARQGICVLTPVFPTSKENAISKKERKFFQESHLKRIECSDSIFVINKDGYIGESTKKEIDYATNLHKEIIYYQKEK